jgi:hypothetical protein
LRGWAEILSRQERPRSAARGAEFAAAGKILPVDAANFAACHKNMRAAAGQKDGGADLFSPAPPKPFPKLLGLSRPFSS